MQYDPIKRTLGKFFNTTPFLRILFYKLLDVLLLRAWHIKHEIKKFSNTLPDNCNILDAGSGFGQYTHFLSRKFPKASIKAVDIKQEQIDDCNAFFKKIKKDDKVRFEWADLTTFNETNRYHLALSVDVMEHIEDDVQVLRNIHSSLKNGGTLIISTPSDLGGSDVHHEHESSFIDEHVRDGYNKLELEQKLRTAGFQAIHSSYSYGRPGKISWKLSMKIPVLLLNKSALFLLILPFYYLITFPFFILLNFLDVHNFQKTGTGLIVTAIK